MAQKGSVVSRASETTLDEYGTEGLEVVEENWKKIMQQIF